jgi:hypothetical protein
MTPKRNVCVHCFMVYTHVWRPTIGVGMLCNSCGIYWRTHRIPRTEAHAKEFSDMPCTGCMTLYSTCWYSSQDTKTLLCHSCFNEYGKTNSVKLC